MSNALNIDRFLPFWSKLTKNQQEDLISNTRLISYKAGDQIHRGSNDCVGILLTKEGRLRTSMLSEDGREITLFHIDAGQVCVLSASCILNAVTFDVFIDAETDAQVFEINTAFFQSLADSNMYVENFIYKVALNRFSDVMWVMEQVLFMSLDKRLALFLLKEQDKMGHIYMTHEQIARNLGSAREVVSRMLKYFAEEGLVALSRGIVQITDKAGLETLTK